MNAGDRVVQFLRMSKAGKGTIDRLQNRQYALSCEG